MATAVMRRQVATVEVERRHGYWTTVMVFLVLAYGLSWWPAMGRLANSESAVVIPIGPSIAALIVVSWIAGRRGRRRLLDSTIDFRPLREIGRVLLIPPTIGAFAIVVNLGAGGSTPGTSEVGSSMLMFAVLPLTAIVAGPLGEELGWRGLLLPHLLERYSAISATAILLPMWLLFHLPLTIAHPDRYGPLWALNVTGIAVTMTWVHIRSSGSVLVAVVFHAIANTSTGAAVLLFPEDERNVPWAIATGMWLVVAAFVAAGPLRRSRVHPAADSPASQPRSINSKGMS